jgi:hypothetical protein
MRKNIRKINCSFDKSIRKACERIPQEKRKFVAMGLCFLFVVFFSIMLWNSVQSQGVQNLLKIEHITPLDLPQDSLIHELKDLIHEQE